MTIDKMTLAVHSNARLTDDQLTKLTNVVGDIMDEVQVYLQARLENEMIAQSFDCKVSRT